MPILGCLAFDAWTWSMLFLRFQIYSISCSETKPKSFAVINHLHGPRDYSSHAPATWHHMETLLQYNYSTVAAANSTHSSRSFNHSSVPSVLGDSSSFLLIFILSLLCVLGVIFLVLGPLIRSEAWQRVDNFVFGRTSWSRNGSLKINKTEHCIYYFPRK